LNSQFGRRNLRAVSMPALVGFFLLIALLLRFYLHGVRSVIRPPPQSLTAVVVDLNTAAEDELTLLKGVGPVRARAIVMDRQRRGPFRSIDEVARVTGIGPVTVEALRDQARVVVPREADVSAR
jgi:competence protein ComEA